LIVSFTFAKRGRWMIDYAYLLVNVEFLRTDAGLLTGGSTGGGKNR
jgi:hypothetical protein